MASKKKNIPVIKKKPLKKPKPLNISAPIDVQEVASSAPHDPDVRGVVHTSASPESTYTVQLEKAEAVAFNEIPDPKEVASPADEKASKPAKVTSVEADKPKVEKLPDSVESGHAKKKLFPF